MGESLRIISRSDEPFKDRGEAGSLLAQALKRYEGPSSVVLGIPRGGIIIGRQIAGILKAELDIVLSRKLGAPGNPEFAIGAVSEDGKLFLHEGIQGEGSRESAYVKKEKEHQMKEIQRRIAIFRKARPKAPLKGRTVIITDDGLATGATMQAAIWSVRQEKPKLLVAAVPVAPEDTARMLAEFSDEMVVLRVPEFFAAVGQFYRYFGQIEDEEVLSILKEAKEAIRPA